MRGFGLAENNYIVLVGDNAVDISLYLSRICSFNHKVLLLDLSSTEMILDIVSPDGYMESQNIHYARYDLNNYNLEQYDIIIIFTNELKNVPKMFYCSNIYFFVSTKKYHLVKLFNAVYGLDSMDNVYVVIRGNDRKDIVLKRMFLSGIPQEIINRVLFISDNDNDNRVYRQIEYNSVFLYDNLSDEIRLLLNNIYKKAVSILFITHIPDEIRIKWVM